MKKENSRGFITLTRNDLIKEIINTLSEKEKEKLYYNNVNYFLKILFKIFPKILDEEGSIVIRNFGTFLVRKKKERFGTNFREGKRMVIPTRNSIMFKPSSILKKELYLSFNKNYFIIKKIKATSLNKKFTEYYHLAKYLPHSIYVEKKDIISHIFSVIKYFLIKGRKLELRKFGVFTIKQTPNRIRINPRTMEKVNVPRKWTVHFKASDILLKEINNDKRKN
jgi:nucleoid DNA-binding protein